MSFVLPAGNTAQHGQIKMFLTLTGTPTINWGTTQFLGRETPNVEAGEYVVYFDYIPALSSWAVGAMAVGSEL